MRGRIGEGLGGRSSAGELSVEQQRQEKRFKATCAAIFGAIKPDGTDMGDAIQSLEGNMSIPQDGIKPAIWNLLSPDTSPVDGRWLVLDWDRKLHIRQLEEAAKRDKTSR